MIKIKNTKSIFLTTVCFVIANFSFGNSMEIGIDKNKISQSFDAFMLADLSEDLLKNSEIYIRSPNNYWILLNRTLQRRWDFDATTKALIGNEIFNLLSKTQFKELSRAFEVTLIRYAFEILPFYGEQKINVIDIKLNEKKALAWLKINMESPSFPDIHLDLLLKRRDGQWKAVDFRFKGITYVNMKKNSYRQDFEELKLQGLLRKLDDKNKVFFRDLCQSDANYIDPKKPPCLQNYD